MPSILLARVGVSAVFFINGFSFASWAPRLAGVKARLALDEAELGLALFGIACGALLAMLATGALATRLGSRLVTTVALVLYLLTPIPWAVAPSLTTLALGFIAIGITAGALDVAMNAQAVAVERQAGRAILNSFHALFSLGGMTGALVTAGVVALEVPLLAHMIIVAAVGLPVGLFACRAMLPAAFDPGAEGPSFALPSRGLLAIGAIAFGALLIEGAVGDWSAVYVTESLAGERWLAAVAFAAFQLAMASMRFAGDQLVERFGPVRVAAAGGGVAAAGLGLALVIGQPLAAILGFTAVGIGMAAIFPITISVAAARGDMAPGNAIAAIATLGYTGFLVGPPTIGALADLTRLPLALGLLPLLALMIALLSPCLRRA